MDKYVIVIGESLSENKLLLKLELGYQALLGYIPQSLIIFLHQHTFSLYIWAFVTKTQPQSL